MKHSLLPIALCGLCFSGFSVAAQNEISVGLADIKNYGDDFIGIEYKRYLSDVPVSGQPFLISPYLNKTNSVFVRYFGDSAVDRYELGGEWFVDDKWVINSKLRYGDFDRSVSFRERYLYADIDAGYFVTPEWQVGGGVIYEYADGRVYGTHRSANETTARVFGRYTNITAGSGWDINMEMMLNDLARVELDARYFFNQRFSAGLSYLAEIDNDSNAYPRDDIAELTVDYWFTPGWSIQAGAGAYTSGGMASITLATSVRF
ncbi:hypothetical protein EXU34_21595 [Alteromonas sp. ZYF713]|nr:hypothetical protein [Alteromonas sp. ZYF713]